MRFHDPEGRSIIRTSAFTERGEEQRRERIGAEPGGPEARKFKAELAPGRGGILRRQAPRDDGAYWEPPSRHSWELAASTGTLGEQAGSIRGLERDCNPDPVNPSVQPPGDRRDDNGNGGTN
ncbi:hypothetical protein NDU88_000426 [Pleurodeles waltl]|uniref:Uncharacterized protein n=1 Tax=Pleurodeles waltl TaxID=8319 RepID=A0AAV7TEV7_PLEWA|nr:hypothetical protein NDU88_000424 [Pleurodeles waltl]KAJ1175135.1 hypothetical protein NDU88_000426 [Pleurodeles waltl]